MYIGPQYHSQKSRDQKVQTSDLPDVISGRDIILKSRDEKIRTSDLPDRLWGRDIILKSRDEKI
jgi:hypothetical protein